MWIMVKVSSGCFLDFLDWGLGFIVVLKKNENLLKLFINK